MGYLALFAGCALILVSGSAVTIAIGLASRLEQVLSVFLVAVSQLVLTLLFTGVVLRSLAAPAVLVVNSAVTVGVLMVLVRQHGASERVRAQWRSLRAVRAPDPRSDPRHRIWAWLLGVGAFIMAVYLTVVTYALPSVSWDALTYHLTAVAAWLRASRILITPIAAAPNFYPLNGELSFLWIGSLTRSDLLIDTPQIVFALAGAAAAAAIGRIAGLTRPGAVVAGSLYFLTPVVLAQSTTNLVDLILPGFFLAGFVFLLRYLQALNGRDPHESQQAIAWVTLAGMGIGLAAGSKPQGLVYAAVAAAVLVVNLIVAVRRRHRPVGLAAAGKVVAAFLLPVLALGSFWYVRTWVEFGNPVYPYGVSVAGVELFHENRLAQAFDPDNGTPPQLRDDSAPVRVLKSWIAEPHRKYGEQQLLGGFGAQWPLLEFPALLIFAVFCLRRRPFLLANLILPFAAMFVLTPANWWSRLTIVIVAPAAIALVFIAERLRRRTLVIALQTATVSIVAVGCAISLSRSVIGPKLLSPRFVLTEARRPPSQRTLSDVVLPQYGWTDQVPRNSRVGLAAADNNNLFIYPLFGTNFRNDVVALTAGDHPTTGQLARSVASQKVDYLYTIRGHALDRLARNQPERYRLFSEDGNARVYRVVARAQPRS